MTNTNAHYDGGLGVAAYDLFAGAGLLIGDIEFYLECASQFPGPILEIGAGTGRILAPLAKAGHEIVGLDLSSAMLELARAKLVDMFPDGSQVQLAEGDMMNFDLGRRFALVLITARSFQHLLEPKQQRAALSCVRRHLATGGHLVLDLFDPYFELLFGARVLYPAPREALDPNSGLMIRRGLVSRATDPMNQTIKETLLFQAIDHTGIAVVSEQTSWTLRWSMRQEIAYLLELCGFEPVAQFSDFKRSPPSYGREQVWIARAI